MSAWASEQGLVLGQRCVDGKSNEITAVPEPLDQLALENSIVTLDAMGGAGVPAGPRAREGFLLGHNDGGWKYPGFWHYLATFRLVG